MAAIKAVADFTTFRNVALHRYELHLCGKLAVHILFLDKPGHVELIHTETAEEFAGQGLANVLVHFALDDVVAAGKRIIPHCPFTARYLRKHEIYTQCIDWPEEAAPKLMGT